MKHWKKNDGYVLPYVLVVFLILSAAAVSICSTSLNNLKAQEAAVERSKALYEAEGEVEKFVAKVSKIPPTNEHADNREGAISEFLNAIDSAKGTNTLDIQKAEDSDVSDPYDLKLQVKHSEVCVETVIRVGLTVISRTETTGEGNDAVTTTYYRVEGIASLTYDSYDISYTGGAA